MKRRGYSYWEKHNLFYENDVCIIGAGFSGLYAAYHLKQLKPDWKILVLEKSNFPHGASSKNGGFACFGSASELWRDLQENDASAVLELVAQRYEGMTYVRELLEQANRPFHACGAYELYDEKLHDRYTSVTKFIPELNHLLSQKLGLDNAYNFEVTTPKQITASYIDVIYNHAEGILNPMDIWEVLYQRVVAQGTRVLMGVDVSDVASTALGVELMLANGQNLKASLALLSTNAFTRHILSDSPAPTPYRNQVFVTNEKLNLDKPFAFHMDEGYYYGRSIGQQLLIGGGRQHFRNSEQTDLLENTASLEEHLAGYLSHMFFDGQPVTFGHKWSGIIAYNHDRQPFCDKISDHVFGLYGLAGIGVALSPVLGQKMAKMMAND